MKTTAHDKQIRIVVTNGDVFWDVFFISQTKEGDFYYGPISEAFKSFGYDKLSRHVSGVLNDPINRMMSNQIGTLIPRAEVPRLGSVEELEMITGISIPIPHFEIPGMYRIHTKKRYDDLMLIDLRNLKSRLKLNVGFVTIDCLSHLSDLVFRRKTVKQLFLSIVTSPWTVVTVADE